MRSQSGLPLSHVMMLMLTQTLGWGTSMSLIGVLAAHIRADLDLSSAAIFGGTTVMFLTGAFLAPIAGGLADRFGGLRVLCYGTPVLAAALLVLSAANGPTAYYAAWVLFGFGMHFGLGTATYNGVAQTAGKSAYRAIGLLTLATGLCSTIFWPLSEALLGLMDWRQLCLLYATATMVIAWPIHIWLAGRHNPMRENANQDQSRASPAHVPPELAGRAFALLMTVQVLTASLTTGMAILAIDIFVALGTSRAEAVFAGSLIGLAYLVSRGGDTLLGNRLPRIRLARFVHAALPLSLLPLLVCAVLALPVPGWLAAVAAVCYGLPAGLLGILRPVLPYHIFGSFNYGLRLGRLGRAGDLANAAVPAAFAWVMSRSAEAVLWLGFGMAVVAFVALMVLSRIISQGIGHRHYNSTA
ncbi:MFS transporter [Mesorhizobium delmotii]|uniref:Putative Major Facilitator Superfamily (MFS) transporter n=1 Tax=Mesorhizobium delmotii TaxID=1631247 RepID=A0A2P9ARG2_9HYPH|nr:MFS transporter [Mesorhizobium delmotii]SJM33724.1 putative Major Facilitator Superfamily (MFS) transporter [Mesorhizobium delmotii]